MQGVAEVQNTSDQIGTYDSHNVLETVQNEVSKVNETDLGEGLPVTPQPTSDIGSSDLPSLTLNNPQSVPNSIVGGDARP